MSATTAPSVAGAEPTRRRSGSAAALFLLAFAQLMVILDGTIVNVALPSMQEALGFSTTGLAWVVNAYTLAFGAFLLLGGRLGDVLGRRRMFVVGLVIFAVASLLGGLAPNGQLLLIARAVQGVGAAITAATTLSLITTSFAEGPERNRAIGVYSAMSGAGASVGLLLGGILTETTSWRWVMFVNVPIGLALAWLAPRVLEESERVRVPMDLPGTLTASAGLGTLVYGLTRAATDGWTDALTLGALALGAALLALFVLIEVRSSHPLLPLWVLRNRVRAGSYVILLALSAALFGAFFFQTQLLQEVLGFSPLQAGLAFLPTSVGIILVSGVTAQLVGRVSARWLAGPGMAITALALLWFAQLDETATYAGDLLPGMLGLALGLGLTFVPVTLAGTSGVGEHEAGLASGVLNTMQQVGAAIGLAVLATVSATATTSALEDAAAQAPAGAAPGGAVPEQVVAHALTEGYSAGFTVAAALALVGAVVSLLVLRRSAIAAPGSAGTADPDEERVLVPVA